MIRIYRHDRKPNLALRVMAGLSMLIGILFLAVSAPFLIIGIAFSGLGYFVLIVATSDDY